MLELNLRSSFVSAKGGVLDFVSPDGEILLSVSVPPGIVPAREYLELCPDGAEVQLSKGLAVVAPRKGYGVQTHDKRCDSGANPDFQPTSADRLQRQMRMMVNQVQAQSKALDARMKAFEKVQRVPAADSVELPEPKDEGGDVV